MFENFYDLFGYNKQLFLLINTTTNHSILPYIFRFVSWFFGISKFAICYFIICMYLSVKISNITNDQTRQQKFWQYFNKMTQTGITYAIFGFCYALMKFTFNLPRPFCSLPPESFQTAFSTDEVRCLSSFPSSHSALSVLIAYFLWPYLSRLQKFIAVIIVFMVMISRITLAMHYPSDILYSLIIIFLIIWMSNLLFRIFRDNFIKNIGKVIYNKFYIIMV